MVIFRIYERIIFAFQCRACTLICLIVEQCHLRDLDAYLRCIPTDKMLIYANWLSDCQFYSQFGIHGEWANCSALDCACKIDYRAASCFRIGASILVHTCSAPKLSIWTFILPHWVVGVAGGSATDLQGLKLAELLCAEIKFFHSLYFYGLIICHDA